MTELHAKKDLVYLGEIPATSELLIYMAIRPALADLEASDPRVPALLPVQPRLTVLRCAKFTCNERAQSNLHAGLCNHIAV